MIEACREISQGRRFMSACVDNIEQGHPSTAIAFFKITRRIINDYPKQTGYLKTRYEEAQKAYEAKFGKLELELI